MQLNLETPALLFSATSLILLAYTNRFLAIATIVRGLKKSYDEEHRKIILKQIQNLNKRVNLVRIMQLFGVMSLFFSVFSMLLLFFNLNSWGIIAFGISLLLLLLSLGVSMWEINISVKALEIHLGDIKVKEKTKKFIDLNIKLDENKEIG